jgi:hypothetical protein
MMRAMEAKILFEEQQGFTKKNSRFFFQLLIVVLFIYCIAFFLIHRAENTDVFLGMVPLLFIIGVLVYLFLKARLITQVREDGIYVRFTPFHRAFKKFGWDNIDHLYLREYNPIREYGGWGIRMGPSGRAYNVSGNTGIQLVLKNGGRVLIGTRMSDDLGQVLYSLGKLNVSSNYR